jgi:hypothetical protein
MFFRMLAPHVRRRRFSQMHNSETAFYIADDRTSTVYRTA